MSGPILVIDDEPSNLATLKQILGSDYPLVFARNGADGLAAAKKHLPALILLDIRMPDMDGYSVCRMLKADPATEGTPVIFVSSLGEVGSEAAGFECGGVDYIIKPVSPAIVRARVRTHLSLVRISTLERYIQQLESEKARTARLSRIQAVLSGTNSAIVRIHESQALIEEACRIAVEHGGFGIAWVGLLNEEGSALQLVASQGIEPDLLSGALPGAEDIVSGCGGIPGRVLRTGVAAYCNDVRAATDCGPTGCDARERGYLSIVGLPLLSMGRTIGVIVLYAREAGYFDDEELKLLNELAGDISLALQAIESEKRASFLSHHDALTGLPNTTLFLEQLDQSVQAARFAGSSLLTCAINLDRFKQLNDALGRHVGDKVLNIVARRLVEALPRSCRTARTGADGFAVVCETVDADDPKLYYELIAALLKEPFSVEGKTLRISASMGIAIYPLDADDAESLFRNAEAALKQAKSYKLPYSYYSPAINARVAERIEMENMLKSALECGQFILHFQPKVDLASGHIIGAEALIRWLHPERGMIPPGEFIPLAEETGLILPMGEWVIRAVCAQQAAWKDKFGHIVPVALNLSALQFRTGNVRQSVCAALAEFRLEPQWVELEVTESMVMQNPEEAEKTMQSFCDLGLHLSLDDFGTGYSSLAYLKRFPFHALKIDRSFVVDVTHKPEDAAIVSAIISMAHHLHMLVVAEGVETLAQYRFLRDNRCDQIQGYFFSRPVAAEDFQCMLCTKKCIEAPPPEGLIQLPAGGPVAGMRR